MKELTGAAFITVAYEGKDHKEAVVKCVVPAKWLWSPEGLADAFWKLRAGQLGNERDNDEDTWESFHIVSMQEDTDFLILDDRPLGGD